MQGRIYMIMQCNHEKRVIIPHPLGGLTLDKVKERAQVALTQVIKVLEKSKK